MEMAPEAAAAGPATALAALGLPMHAPVARRTVALSGGRSLSYAETGEGAHAPPVVLIHGTLMTLEDMWIALAPTVSSGRRVIALDRPGHGLSLRRRGIDASPWRQAALIHEGLAAIGVERAILVGHSYGATVALCAALAHPEAVAGVVALAPLCFPELRMEQILFGARGTPGLADLLSPALAHGHDALLLPLLWRAIFLPQAMPAAFRDYPYALACGTERMIAEGEDAMAAAPALARAMAAYAGCRVPVRILGGSADLVVNNALHGALAAQAIPGAAFEWVGGAGHMLHHFHQDRVTRAVATLAQG